VLSDTVAYPYTENGTAMMWPARQHTGGDTEDYVCTDDGILLMATDVYSNSAYVSAPADSGAGAIPYFGPVAVVSAYDHEVYLRSSGGLTPQQEQARRLYEVFRQARLETKRTAFDALTQLRADSQTFAYTECNIARLSLQRAQGAPVQAGIRSGKFLNALL